jgi:hypothetical protein
MRKRIAVAGLGVLLHLSPAFAQLPQPIPSVPPGTFPAPRSLPPTMFPEFKPLPPLVQPPPPLTGMAPVKPEVQLPLAEQMFPIDPGAVTMKLIGASWQVWAGQRVMQDVGTDQDAAKEIVRIIRELRPTEWATIGSPRPFIQYGLSQGKPVLVAGFPKTTVPIDLRSVRVEAIRGAWLLRDDSNLLFNFGSHRAEADQAAAVVQKYGFNRIGIAGTSAQNMTYFYAIPENGGIPAAPAGGLPAAFQEQALTRTGIPVPGVGFVGEMIKIDARKVEVRKDGFEWVVAFGPDVVAKFGPAEFLARDAAKVIQDGRFTEFCRVGSHGLTFFLVNGKSPTKVPFAAQVRRFDPTALRTQPVADRWCVTDNGRPLFDVADAAEGDMLIRLLKAYQFDEICQVGQTARASMVFLAKVK